MSCSPSRLTIMAAGAAHDVERVRPLLEILGSTIFVVGEHARSGPEREGDQQPDVGVRDRITSEAAALGVKAGVDPATLLEVVAASSGTNAAADVRGLVRDSDREPLT
jgi:3-hydroxyisobutyrate dehydrogenase-like beta-hydroxyacid dehydrogenase